MGRKDLYKYYCTTQGKYIRQKIEVGDPAPTVCKHDAGHTVDWSTLTIYNKLPRKEYFGLENVDNIKDNITIDPPTVTDDEDNGYSSGSKWIDSVSEEVWICIDPSLNSAVWKKITDNMNGENIGVGGIGIFKQKNGENLQFKKLNAGSNKIGIVDDTSNNEIDIDISEGNIVIGNLSGAPMGSVVGTSDTQTLTNKTWGDNLNMNSNKIINLSTPTTDGDATSKSYVDGIASGLDIKDSVIVASTTDLNSNFSISGSINYNATGGSSGRGQITATLVTTDVFTLDGINFGASENESRILLKNQSSGEQNGIWTITISGTSLTLDRAVDFDEDVEVTSGAFMFVEQGNTNANSGWTLTTNDPIIIGGASGTSLSFVQFSGAGQITAGNGLTKTGNILDVDLKANGGLVIETNKIAVDLGASSITGTLTVGDGGTGATTFTSGNFLQGNGTSAITASKTVPSGNVVGTTDTQTLTNKTINSASNTITIGTSNVTSGTFANARIAASNVTQHEGSITIGNLSGAPSGSVVGTTDVQTLSNKTLTSPILTTPQINDTSATHQYIFDVSELTADRTITMPLLTGNDTFVFQTHAQTLTNKTINTASNTITIAAADITSGTFANARIAASNVTQHEGSITIGNLSGAPAGAVVGTTDSQTLTNKTIIGSTNSIEATLLATTGSGVVISSAAPPSTGQILKATSSTTATWQNESGGGGTSRKIDTYYDPIVETILTTIWADIPMNVNRIIDSDFTHLINTADITINTTDTYLIIARCSTYVAASNNRSQTQMRLMIDTGSGYSQLAGSLGYMYNREVTEGYSSATVSIIMTLSAGNKIKMQAIQTSGSSTIHAASEACSITINNV